MSVDWRDLLERVLDGERLSDTEARVLSDALDDAANRREAAELIRFAALVASEFRDDAAPSRERLLAKVVLADRAAGPRRRIGFWGLTAAAAAAVLIAAGAWLYVAGRYPEPQLAGDFRVVDNRVVAGPKGAHVYLGGYCDLTLEPGTEIFLKGEPGKEAVAIEQGSVRSKIIPNRGGFTVETPLGTLKVIGTEFTTTVRRDAESPEEAKEGAETAARAFMTAMMKGDAEALAKVAIEPLPKWAEEGLRETSRQLEEGLLEKATEISEMLMEDGFAAVRIGRFDGGSGALWNIFVVLRRTPAGWRVVYYDDDPAESLLADHLKKVMSPTPFDEMMTALHAGDVDRVKRLLDAHPDLVRGRDDVEGRTVLHRLGNALVSGPQWLMRGLPGGRLPAPPPEYLRPLRDVAAMLIDRGADVEAKDQSGWTPLFVAVSCGNVEMAKVLLDRGADVNVQAASGTPLLILLQNSPFVPEARREELAALLLKAGADPLLDRGLKIRNLGERPVDVVRPDIPIGKLVHEAALKACEARIARGGVEVDGTRVSLASRKPKWNADEDVCLQAVVSVDGRRPLRDVPSERTCTIEVDGQSYRYEVGIPSPVLDSPGDPRYLAFTVRLDDRAWWNDASRKHPTLSPGKHTVRIAFKEPAPVESNAVEFEIVRAVAASEATALSGIRAAEQRRAEAVIAQFSNPVFAVRQQAVEELVKMGPAVLPLVRKTLAETKDNEVKLRCEMVIKGLGASATAVAPKTAEGATPMVPAPDARALLKSIPVLTNNDPKIESLLVTAEFFPGRTTVKAAWRKDGKCSLRVTDAAGVPVAVIADGRMLLFDSLSQKVVTVPKDCKPQVRLSSEAEQDGRSKIKFGLGVLAGEDAKPDINVDIASFFRGFEDALMATPNGRTVILSAASNKIELSARLALGAAFPCESFKMQEPGEVDPLVRLQMKTNVPLDDSLFVLPDVAALKKHLVVEEPDVRNKGAVDGILGSMQNCMAIAAVRTMMDNPAARAEAEKQLGRKVNWDAAKEFDRKLREALKEQAQLATAAAERPQPPPVAVTVSVASGIVAYNFGGETGQLVAGESRTFPAAPIPVPAKEMPPEDEPVTPAAKIAEPDVVPEPDIDKLTADELFARAWAAKDRDEQVRLYTRVIELDPKRPAAWQNRGFAHLCLNQSDLAIADFNKCLELDPKNAYAYNNRGQLMLDRGLLDDALSDLNKSIEYEPRLPYPYNHRGQLYVRRGMYDLAVADFSKSIELLGDRDDKWLLVHLHRAKAYYRLKEFDKAWADVKYCREKKIPVPVDFLHDLEDASGKFEGE